MCQTLIIENSMIKKVSKSPQEQHLLTTKEFYGDVDKIDKVTDKLCMRWGGYGSRITDTGNRRTGDIIHPHGGKHNKTCTKLICETLSLKWPWWTNDRGPPTDPLEGPLSCFVLTHPMSMIMKMLFAVFQRQTQCMWRFHWWRMRPRPTSVSNHNSCTVAPSTSPATLRWPPPTSGRPLWCSWQSSQGTTQVSQTLLLPFLCCVVLFPFLP